MLQSRPKVILKYLVLFSSFKGNLTSHILKFLVLSPSQPPPPNLGHRFTLQRSFNQVFI